MRNTQNLTAVDGGDHDSGGDSDDGHPGTPWTPPDDPSPDGSTPPGDGDHRK
ncbi:hypothetical protein AB0D04_01995 [Streptomyces sp. NPDC048483]|uniref:hypothetical protein n=1 Tax=Streptomyces sp. NPDC048483 TaxID=3154927 RepID=UPI003433CBE2